MEITRARSLVAALERGGPFAGVRVQNVDLDDHTVAAALLASPDLTGLVVLGGPSDPALTGHLVRAGAVVFPAVTDAPVNIYRHRLYTADELYGGLERGYAATVDARAYRWTLDRRAAHDAYCTVLRAIHDDAINDALGELSATGGWVGVMGGHAAQRGSATYATTARLGHLLASAGRVVVTGGGPGAMEAANLGALAVDLDAVERACADLAAVPSFAPDVTAWARTAMAVRDRLIEGHRAARGPEGGDRVRSLGIPTWFYGHEPPNVFAQRIAKYFSNALREDTLLARSTGGVIVQAGAAGTVQEIFQLATRLYYGAGAAAGPSALAPLVLVGVRQWNEELPAWPLLQSLAHGREMAAAIHLVDTIEEAVAVVADDSPAGVSPVLPADPTP